MSLSGLQVINYSKKHNLNYVVLLNLLNFAVLLWKQKNTCYNINNVYFVGLT